MGHGVNELHKNTIEWFEHLKEEEVMGKKDNRRSRKTTRRKSQKKLKARIKRKKAVKKK